MADKIARTKCPKCTNTYIYTSALNRHVKNAHGGKK